MDVFVNEGELAEPVLAELPAGSCIITVSRSLPMRGHDPGRLLDRVDGADIAVLLCGGWLAGERMYRYKSAALRTMEAIERAAMAAGQHAEGVAAGVQYVEAMGLSSFLREQVLDTMVNGPRWGGGEGDDVAKLAADRLRPYHLAVEVEVSPPDARRLVVVRVKPEDWR